MVGAVDFEEQVAVEGGAGFDAVELGDLEAGNVDQLGVTLLQVHEGNGGGTAVALDAVVVEDGLDFGGEIDVGQFLDGAQVITATQPCLGRIECADQQAKGEEGLR